MVLLNLVVKPLWIFGIDRNVQLAVGNASYGTYFALLNLTFVFSMLLDLGLTMHSSRAVAADASKINVLFADVLWAKFFLMLLYFAVLYVCCFIFYGTAFHFKIISILAALQFLNSLLQFLRSNIAANHYFKMDSLLSVLDKLLVIAVCGIILLHAPLAQKFTITHFIVIQIIGYIIAIIIAWVQCQKYTSAINYNVHLKRIFPLILQGIPYTLVVLLMGIYTRSDSFLIERLLPDGQLQSGLYASIYRLLDTCNMIGFLFAGMLLPIFARLLGGGKSVAELIGLAVDILMPISIGVVCFAWFYGADVMQLLTKVQDAKHALAFAILMSSFPALCLMNIYSTLLTANNNIKILTEICAVGAVLSLVLNAICIPKYGYIGAAAISVIVQWCVAILFLIQAKRQCNLPSNARKICMLTILSAVLLCANFFMQQMQISFLFSILCNAILFLSMVWALKLWKWQSLLQYINS
jgi:O-antigen/teichoic acid export membrane protein